MPRLLRSLIVLLGLCWLDASAASAAVASHAEKPASGSATVVETLINESARLNGEGVSEIPAIAYDFASDFPVAAKGAKAEADVVSRLGDQVAGQRVTLESTTGQRSVTDIVTTDKGVVEVKSGGATLSPGQKAVKADIDAGRNVIPRGQNAEKAGLTPGQPTKMKCYDVERC